MTHGPLITKGRLATLIIVAILLIDQAIKIWVKTSMTLHESIRVTDWFYITFIENMGMAFGLAGTAGNLIDCMFYGMMFNESSPYYLSYLVDFGTGYAPFLMGKVVDMFYFPLIETEWPTWMPFVGGQHFVFFSPVFNFADASISVSVVLLLLFYREEISKITLKKETNNVEE